MTPEERFLKIEEGIRGLIAVGRTCLESIQELREVHREDHQHVAAEIREMREAQSATDEKLNILIDTVERIVRRDAEQ